MTAKRKTKILDVGAFMVGSAKTIRRINRGGMKAAELRESFVRIRSATRMQILFLNPLALAAQRNDCYLVGDFCINSFPTMYMGEESKKTPVWVIRRTGTN
jgi:hypothetical protein